MANRCKKLLQLLTLAALLLPLAFFSHLSDKVSSSSNAFILPKVLKKRILSEASGEHSEARKLDTIMGEDQRIRIRLVPSHRPVLQNLLPSCIVEGTAVTSKKNDAHEAHLMLTSQRAKSS